MKFKFLLAGSLILFSLNIGFSQRLTNNDSIRSILKQPMHDTIKIMAFANWDNQIYKNDPSLDFLLNEIIDSLCRIQISEQFYKNSVAKYHSSSLNVLGTKAWRSGESEKAKTLHTESLKIRLVLMDKRGIAGSHGNLGLVYWQLADLDSAEYHLQQALEIFKEMGNVGALAQTNFNIGNILKEKGEFEKADDFYKRSQVIREELKDLKGLGSCYNNRGTIQALFGNYQEASNYYSMALNLRVQIDDQRGLSETYGNLANMYFNLGELEKSLVWYNKSLALSVLRDFKNIQATCLYNMGLVHSKKGEFSLGLKYLSESAQISFETGSKITEATSYVALSELYLVQEDLEKAELNINKAIQIYQELENLRGLSVGLNQLSKVFLAKGHIAFQAENTALSQSYYSQAIQYAVQAVKNTKSTNEMRTYRASLVSNFSCELVIGNLDSAEKIIQTVLELRYNEMKINFPILSEREKEAYLKTMNEDFEMFYDFCFHTKSAESIEMAYDNALLVKGLLLKSSTAMRKIILESEDNELIDLYNNWISLKRRIANLYSKGNETKVLEENANLIEKELVKKSQVIAELNKIQSLSWKDVQTSLSSDEAAIEFVRFEHILDYHYPEQKRILYCALIVTKESEHPEMIELFYESELQEILGNFPGNNVSYINQVYGTKENTKLRLYDLIWEPMNPFLENKKKVHISPVGLLHKISFSALAVNEKVYLCDVHEIEMNTTTGKIVSPEKVVFNYGSYVSLFGGINYNSDSSDTEIWQYLEGTKKETENILKILERKKVHAHYFSNHSATEEEFKAQAGKSSILHIATHGFFFANPDEIEEKLEFEISEDQQLVFRGTNASMAYTNFVTNQNPMMRSGIVLAGANDVWSQTYKKGEDGIVTAQEVSTIDMRATDLVVLSACETGLGDIKGLEGVYGLQRSFKMAGVKFIIMSLWQVPDKETAEFMASFYKNLIKIKNVRQAFSVTQHTMREKYDPYYWAAFILIE